MLEIRDGRALAEEFGVRDDGEGALRLDEAHDVLDPVPRAHRDGRFRHHHGITPDRLRDVAGTGEDMGEVGMAVAAPGGRADGDEHDFRVAHRLGEIGAEAQAPGGDVVGDERVEMRLVDRHATRAQGGDPLRILVDAMHMMPEFGKARPGYETDISDADDRHPHSSLHGSFR